MVCWVHKLNQYNNSVKNSTTLCVECVYNWAIVDQEFQALLEYVEHQFLCKVVMGLEITWKEKGAQKIKEYIKNARLGS